MLPASKDPEREKEGQRDCDPTQECHSHCSFKSAAMVWSTLVQIIVYENSNPCCWTCSCKCHCWCNLLRKHFPSQNRRKPAYIWQLSHNMASQEPKEMLFNSIAFKLQRFKYLPSHQPQKGWPRESFGGDALWAMHIHPEAQWLDSTCIEIPWLPPDNCSYQETTTKDVIP